MFGRGGAAARMRGRNDGGAQKRRVLVTVCALVVMFSAISLYHGSFFGNRTNKSVVEETFDPTASGWAANLAAGIRGESGRGREVVGADVKAVKDEVEEEVEEKEEVAGEKDAFAEKLEGNDDESGADERTSEDGAPKSFPVCDAQYTENIPCLDLAMNKKLKLKLNHSVMEHYERHCPPSDHRLNCLIPPPPNYKVAIRWPKSRDEVWQSNVPHTFLATEKSDQHWMVVNGQKVNFPGGGTHFPNGADKYISNVAKMLKDPEGNLSMGGKIRTVLDVGCGVASFGAYLLPLDIIAMSLAPNDVHQNQIQFALERGIPATLGVLGTKRQPFPSKSFDLAHCSRCRIEWHQRDGILLLEVDRLLRPGGYFVWSAPPAYREDPEDQQIWKEMTALVTSMCWTVAAHQDQTVIWQKPLTNDCYEQRPEGQAPPLCKATDPDSAWNVPMEACITPLTDEVRTVEPWPKRLLAPSPRLDELRIDDKKYLSDTSIWRRRVEFYWKTLKAANQVEQNSVRNIMDMNANYGGFAAALRDKDLPVWVMNVVPSAGPNTLGIVYDRGFIGSLHNWCEAFSTYPRTYDLLHAWSVFSDIEKENCSIEDLLLEMDRILRPMGIVIIRDKADMVDRVSKYLTALRWSSWHQVVEADKDGLSDGDEKILFARKELWQPEDVL
ncbi:hypothetical protein M758_1G067100 [Ceratodon purpureus]|uniref:Methyltransferase n=1 Tax=Ceratodon purpureus TaxID=3225 RepID=A0A8T0J4C0_CERPU|nr:hypothetical protein KC19_1G068500 [Ceratodon purpureus]KAG0628973.1 hypothetical protein M758_1G067100 [Ceratodon purpureus]